MSQENLSLSGYQFRIALRRTSPHVWRRVLLPCHGTLLQLHRTIRALFGWSDAYPHQFLIRGKSFQAKLADDGNETGAILLSDFQFYLRERFFYDYRFDLQTPVWRHEIRVEKITLVQEKGPGPRCIAGAGTPPPEPVASPQEFHHIKDLFTPAYILHRLAEMIDRGHDDQRIANEVRYLRPWLTAGEFCNRAANRQLATARSGVAR
jgi:hypothetical protein